MSSKARQYLASRNRFLASRYASKQPLLTELEGVSVTEQEKKRMQQQVSDEEAKLAARGLVPVAVDFANIAAQCGVVPVEEEVLFSPNKWLPAWYLAAWEMWKRRTTQDAYVLTTPTDDFRRYIKAISGDVKEQLMLVAELQLTAPYQSPSVAAGVNAWVAQHADIV